VEGEIVGRIETGLLVLLGVGQEDTPREADYLVDKIVHLRIFADEAGKMNRSLIDVQGAMLVVSQFTLYGDCRQGRRPSFVQAAPAALARSLYERFCEGVRARGVALASGVFQADMQVTLVNDGPVTLIVDSGLAGFAHC
jgi:D-tyrosyl-tRNA(Tyr) deacylase